MSQLIYLSKYLLGYEIQVRPRSGLAAKHGIGILNSPGTVDSDYRGEIKIILINFGKEDFTIQKGDRIAQLIVSRVFRANFNEENSLNDSKRGIRWFRTYRERIIYYVKKILYCQYVFLIKYSLSLFNAHNTHLFSHVRFYSFT